MGSAFVRNQREEARGVRFSEAPGHAATAGMVDLKAIAVGKLRGRFWKRIVRHGSSPGCRKPASKNGEG